MQKKSYQLNYTQFEGMDELEVEDKELMLEAKAILETAYAPYSKFKVGCALLLENGKVVLGNNQENAAYPSGMCAERVAIWKASSDYPGIRVMKMAIAIKSSNQVVSRPVSPCGSCRQTLSEYEINQEKPMQVFFTGETGPIIMTESVLDLLPLHFDSSYL